MQSLPETFRNCKSKQSGLICHKCNATIYNKRLNIEDTEFRILKKLGITHKAVNFCSNPDCSFLEQGIIYNRGNKEKFLTLKEMDALMAEAIELAKNMRKSNSFDKI